MMNTAISIGSVSKVFKRDRESMTALHEVTMDIRDNEFFMILGPSGCGKSTLLRIMSGLDTATRGTVKYGENLDMKRRGFVFQHFALLPWLTVRQNIELALLKHESDESKRKKIVHAELERFGLTKFEKSFPKELSGGMRQRVGLARAFAVKPDVLFLDEPFSELDSFIAEELRLELLTLWKEQKMTVVMVTHLIPEALELGDRIAVMTGRPGTINAIIDNTLPRPRNKRSPEFFALEEQECTDEEWQEVVQDSVCHECAE